MRNIDPDLYAQSKLTRGFASDIRLRHEDRAVRLQCRFHHAAYDPALFAKLGIPIPDPVKNAVPKRRAEFLAGRILANCAQSALGRTPAPVDIRPDRAPRWPDGLSGSIAHASDICACLVTDAPGRHPGIDVERIVNNQVLGAIFSVCLNTAERQLIEQVTHIPGNVAATIAFSAKETLFKALYPPVGRFFDFSCAALLMLSCDGFARLRLTQTLAPDIRENQVFDIRYVVDEEHVTTWMIFDDASAQISTR